MKGKKKEERTFQSGNLARFVLVFRGKLLNLGVATCQLLGELVDLFPSQSKVGGEPVGARLFGKGLLTGAVLGRRNTRLLGAQLATCRGQLALGGNETCRNFNK